MEVAFITMLATGAVALASAFALRRAGTTLLEQGRFGVHYRNTRAALNAYSKQSGAAVVVLAVFMTALLLAGMQRLGGEAAAAFVGGVVLSYAAAYGAMLIVVRGRARMREHSGGTMATFREALQAAHAVSGIVVGLALFSVAAVYAAFGSDAFALAALALGSSLVAVVARLGGSMYVSGLLAQDTTTAHERAAFVEAGEIAAAAFGEAAELFQTITVALAGAVVLGAVLFAGLEGAATLPIAVVATGFAASILSVQLVRVGMTHNILRTVYLFVGAAVLLSVLFLFPVVSALMSGNAEYATFALFGAAVVGIGVGALSLFLGEYYGSSQLGRVKRVARAALTNFSRLLLVGFALGFEAAAVLIVLVALGVVAGFGISGLYGVGIALAGILALSAIACVVQTLGSIAEADTRTATGHVADSVALVGPLFRMLSASGAAIVLFVGVRITGAEHAASAVAAENIPFIGGLLAGVAVVALFSSRAAASASRGPVFVRRVVRVGLESAEDYARASSVIVRKSMSNAVYPGVLAFALPVLVGFTVGFEVLSGLLLGVIFAATLIALFGGAAANAWSIAGAGVSADEPRTNAALAEGAHLGALLGVGVAPALTTLAKAMVALSLLLTPFFV